VTATKPKKRPHCRRVRATSGERCADIPIEEESKDRTMGATPYPHTRPTLRDDARQLPRALDVHGLAE
jgi:hypothetical protein